MLEFIPKMNILPTTAGQNVLILDAIYEPILYEKIYDTVRFLIKH